MAERSTRRQEIYKNKEQLKPEEIRRRRGEAQIVLRRQKREENLLKNDNGPLSLEPLLIQQLYDNDAEVVLQATTTFRKLLSKEKIPLLKKSLELELFPV
ncbi:hypothetical protein DSO57_1039218 [Entomophthora muscae]|uniref:Uncharacterized protein n=1 Tax=Entomophthora muscae TaxID=34485 RepID=A0ACC2S0C5_9FUNG|nr:hypothetical protein DSO57_1039218 [Entomophthora muscae]